MKINVFMATAGDQWEKEVLKNMGAGIQTWINNQGRHQYPLQGVRLGRWAQYEVPKDVDIMDYVYAETYEPCDVAIMFGSWKTREKAHTSRAVR